MIVFGHTPVYGLLNDFHYTENLDFRSEKMGASIAVQSPHGLLLDDRALSMTMSLIIQVFLPQTTEEAGMDIFHCKPQFLI